MDTARGAILKVARREMWLHIRHASTGDIVLVVVLAAMIIRGYLLVLLVVLMLVLMLVVLIVLEGLAEIHLHRIILLPCPPVHHDIMGLVPMTLVEHAELLRRLAPGRSRWRGSIGVVEGDAGASDGRAHPTGKVSYVLSLLRVEGLAGSPLVDRVLGHLRIVGRAVSRVPGAAAGTVDESPGTMLRKRASGGR